ncbi:MAG: beta-ketoacyl-ACP reductase [Bernardetiaceae bacterium]|nr:beta-ketoacyl-ACP reductase [Bernardetiaceae bacterium]
MYTLTNQVAIITGAAQGIGKATALLFLEAGAKVTVWDKKENLAEALFDLQEKYGDQLSWQNIDTTEVEKVQAATAEVVRKHGHIDILVNNAGILRDASFLKMEDADWHAVMNVNLNGVYNCIKAVLPYMKAQNYGRVLNASSIVGIYGNFGQSNYAAAKAAVIGMTKSISREVGKYGITVNAIAPGFIRTDMTDSIPENYRQQMIQSISVRREGKPEDIAQAYLFLASEAASFITGTVLCVDGGMTM